MDESMLHEIVETVNGAANGARVTRIRLAVGKGVSFSRVELAKKMQELFPDATLELEEGKESGSVVVRDIEVE